MGRININDYYYYNTAKCVIIDKIIYIFTQKKIQKENYRDFSPIYNCLKYKKKKNNWYLLNVHTFCGLRLKTKIK